MEENGYVEYSRWFDTIEEELNEENYVGKIDEFEHFVFNGLHIYKNGNNTVIMDEEKDKPDTRYFRRMERYYDELLKSHKIIISGGSGMPAIIYGDNSEGYVYLPTDITKKPTRFETESYETRELESYETRGIVSSDVIRIMSYAKSKAVNEDTKKVYDEVIGLYDDIESAYSVAITYQNRRDMEQNDDNQTVAYDEYCKWFEVINNACNENNLSRKEGNGDEHYILSENIGNSMNVCKRTKNDSVIIIVSEEEIDPDAPGTQPYCTFAKNKYGNITMRFFSSPLLGDIFYAKDNSYTYPGVRNFSYTGLPDEMDRMYSKPIKGTENIGELLDDAIGKTTNEIYQRELRKAKEFYDSLSQIMEREKSGYDEYGYPKDIEDDDTPGAISEDVELDDSNASRTNDDAMFSQAGDFTPDELEQMSAEELEKMLRATVEQNATKKQVLEETESEAKRKEDERKKALIAQIGQAIEEGKDLDAKITEAKAITKENK